jgi:hypothetical protein
MSILFCRFIIFWFAGIKLSFQGGAWGAGPMVRSFTLQNPKILERQFFCERRTPSHGRLERVTDARQRYEVK